MPLFEDTATLLFPSASPNTTALRAWVTSVLDRWHSLATSIAICSVPNYPTTGVAPLKPSDILWSIKILSDLRMFP